MIVLGLSGPYASGKGEVLKFLEERGFVCLSLSEVIRDELKEQGCAESREAMIEIGNELRRKNGPGALATRVLPKLQSDRNYVIDSIRNPAEVCVLRAGQFVFRLLWIDAPPDVRFQRLRDRGRTGDPESYVEFQDLEARERAGASEASQQLDAVREMADATVQNDGSIDQLWGNLQRFLATITQFERPGWDEYFLDIAYVVASRSNCMKRKIAAVITLDRRIISTGYNGTPRGVRNCNEGGCPRCNRFAPGGTALDECLCSHAEENAITQAAYHGVGVKGGTLYTTFSPCLLCTKMIINAGIAEVVFAEDYTVDERARALLLEARVRTRRFSKKQKADGSEGSTTTPFSSEHC